MTLLPFAVVALFLLLPRTSARGTFLAVVGLCLSLTVAWMWLEGGN